MEFNLTTRSEGDVIIIKTSGYLNNVGGEQIAEACYKEIDKVINKNDLRTHLYGLKM